MAAGDTDSTLHPNVTWAVQTQPRLTDGSHRKPLLASRGPPSSSGGQACPGYQQMAIPLPPLHSPEDTSHVSEAALPSGTCCAFQAPGRKTRPLRHLKQTNFSILRSTRLFIM